ncbi:hypothetical protein EB796_005046 [Bugula neritina]|uniref:JmjC domain-containing protein n=1 Tax=Bugula neritina TaxID=10212 RepID=A0A7J7KEL8_BUGNE|nr:hypothetical protein EB796_005046 [Bugula neritina]
MSFSSTTKLSLLLLSYLVVHNASISHHQNNFSIPDKYSDLNKCLVVPRVKPGLSDKYTCDLADVKGCDDELLCTQWLLDVQNAFVDEGAVFFVKSQHDIEKTAWLFSSWKDIRCSECSIVVYDKPAIDRECLMSALPTSPHPPAVINQTSVSHAVNEINTICNTFRGSNGNLNSQGIHRSYILDNLFSVKQMTNHAESVQVFGVKGQSKPLLPTCEKVSVNSWDEFFTNYLQFSKPVIIENVASAWKANTLWTNAYLKKKYGNMSVHIKLSPTTDYEGIEKADLWKPPESFKVPHIVKKKLQFPDLVVPRPAPVNMRFAQYLDLMKNISEGMLTNISAYLEYSSIRQYFPELEQDLVEMPFVKNKLHLKHLNIWLSDGNTLGKLHFDPFDNFLCMIDGKKELILFEPHNNTQLYETHIPEAQFTVDLETFQFARKELLESTSMVMSPLDIKKPDYERFPKFQNTLPLNCTIEEGDVLFMPAFWWHEVQSYPNHFKKRNLAVNFWYEPFLTKEFPCSECKLDINPLYKNLL